MHLHCARLPAPCPCPLALALFPQNDWKLVYSTDQHGYSLKTLYRKVRHCGPIVLVAMDTSSHVFGAYASEDVHVRVCM